MILKVRAGALAGLIGGLVFGVMMQMMNIPLPDGVKIPMMAMVAKVVHSESLVIGWLYHFFNSAVIGVLFGWFIDDHIHGYTNGFTCGALYGILWWILGAIILMPILLGMPPFAPLMIGPMRMIAMASLMGHIIYGMILGGSFTYLVLGASFTRLIRKGN